MNEELAAPILTSVSSAWEAVFVKDLDNHLKQLMCEIKSVVKKFHELLTPKLLQAGPWSWSQSAPGSSSSS